MDLTNSAVWFAIALVFIIAVTAKIAIGRTTFDPICNRPHPPLVNSGSLIKLLLTKGPQAMIHDQHKKLGSVFTVSFFGLKVTFLVGPEASGHFYQGLESEISHGNTFEFLVPIFGKEVGYGADIPTRTEQMHFYNEALKLSKRRSNVDPMVKEVEDYFSKWGEHGVVDLKHEFEKLIMLVSSRCLLGKEVREKMFGEVYMLFRELYNGMHLTSVLFPYAPSPVNRRRDRARTKLSKILIDIVRSRKAASDQVERDVLQNLIDSKYKDGRSTTEEEVTGLIIMLLFGGNHTSSVTSTWTGAYLLSHESCLTAVVEEQKKIIRKYGNHIDYNVLQEMNTLHCCIKETLRMHPVQPINLRKVHKNFTVQTREGNEYEIPRGHTIASPVLYNNSLPHIYKDPDAYDPDRFSLGREEDRVGGTFSYTSFGGGRHRCVGEAYAYMQIKVIWSHLLRNFELKLVTPFPKTNWSKLVPEPKGKVMVSFKRVAAA
ncbi:hypothetical protein GQ55_5G192300 [Panicum hallii var. hallii]|uniref:Obtusifoliol 14-alpha demethylase n=1 Tax=Panicum hallii var. hallii TaxID=1504633 RepID=A0A2T7DHY6_9POAL|nr:hypothetical protein GQ55_5G192300 [Panicum hallii var. hallii]